MKSRILSVLVAMAMIVAGVAFTSCGDDDDDIVPVSKATTATVQPSVYVAEDMLNYYDITVTVDGSEVTLTKDNTTGVTDLGYNLRKYKPAASVFKAFPTKMTVVAQCAKKSTVELSDMDDTDYCLYVTADYSNDNKDNVSALSVSSRYLFSAGLHYTKMDEETLNSFINRTITATYTMSSASAFEQTLNDTFKF